VLKLWQTLIQMKFKLTLAATALAALVALPVYATEEQPDENKVQTGYASYYASNLTRQKTATGEAVDPDLMTAAHWHLPLGSWAKVTNLDNGRSIKVRINDRSAPNVERIIDLSQAAAKALGMIAKGIAEVMVEPTTRPFIAPLPPHKPANLEKSGAIAEQHPT
jgi:rare lipoprotein A